MGKGIRDIKNIKTKADHKEYQEGKLPQVRVTVSESGTNYLVTYQTPKGAVSEPISRQSTREQVQAFIQHLHPAACTVVWPQELG